jgi:hypothetical protein
MQVLESSPELPELDPPPLPEPPPIVASFALRVPPPSDANAE